MDYLPPLQVLWDYLSLHREPRQAEVIVGFGCYDTNVARRAAQLYAQGYAPKVLFTGGLGRNTSRLFSQSEAEVFAQVAMDLGVPREAILLECRATNTKENILFARALLEETATDHRRILGVHKHYMERRIAAAMGVYWPEQAFTVTSFPQTLEEALSASVEQGMTRRDTIATIVGDVQRIRVYAQRGFQLPQVIPEAVWEAYETLCSMGFDSQLVK